MLTTFNEQAYCNYNILITKGLAFSKKRKIAKCSHYSSDFNSFQLV